MARRCELCGKGTLTGNNVSHAHNKTRRVWRPNLVKIQILENGARKTIRVCTRCLRTGNFVKA